MAAMLIATLNFEHEGGGPILRVVHLDHDMVCGQNVSQFPDCCILFMDPPVVFPEGLHVRPEHLTELIDW